MYSYIYIYIPCIMVYVTILLVTVVCLLHSVACARAMNESIAAILLVNTMQK